MARETLRFFWDAVRRSLVRGSLAAVIIYVMIALFVFYPVPFQLDSVIAGFAYRDGWQYTWWLWFAKRVLLEGRGLDNLFLMNHPVGLYHPFQWTLTYLSLVALPLELLFSPAATFNLMVLGAFVLSGLSAYHLCRELTHDHWAAVVGGAVFAYCPNRLGHAMAGWLPQMTVYLYPWYALLLIRTLRQPTLRRAVGLGVLAGIAATVYVMHVAYFMVPLTLVLVGAELIQRRRTFFSNRRICCLAGASAIALAIFLPFLLPLIAERLRGGLDYLSIPGVVGHSTDLLAFFTPSPYHPVLGLLGLVPSFAERVLRDEQAMRAALAYPGVIAVLLALWGLFRARSWRWFVLAAGAALFSLGPILVVGGKPLEVLADGYPGHVLLPYALVRAIPFLDWGRTPGRINAVGMLGLGVLAAFGLAEMRSRLSARRWWGRLIAPFLLVLVVFEFLPIWPFPVGDARIPPVIRHLADQPGEGAVLHLPMSRRSVNHRALYFQTALTRPIVGGEVHRMLPETLPWWETIEGLVKEDTTPDVIRRPSIAQRRSWLRQFDVDWLLLHQVHPADEGRYRAFVEALLGPAAVEDGILRAYQVPADVLPPASPILYTFSRSGWHEPEQDGELWRRWMTNDGQLYVYSTHEDVGSLQFTIDSHLAYPVLEVYFGDELLDAFVVGDRTAYTTRPFTLAKGMNVFRFHAPGGCPEVLDDPRCWQDALLTPVPVGDTPPCDASLTCRTFVFDDVAFVSQGELPDGMGLDVSFGDQVRLRGWALEKTALNPGDTLTVTLSWEPVVVLTEGHVAFVHLLSSDGSLVAQYDGPLVGQHVALSAWSPGTVFQLPVSLDLAGDLPSGDYRVVLGVYLWPSLDRLDLPEDADDALELGVVEVLP